jgi:hypothetical protein
MDNLIDLFNELNISYNIDDLCNQFDNIKIEPDKFILTKNNTDFIIYRNKSCFLEYKFKNICILPYIN